MSDRFEQWLAAWGNPTLAPEERRLMRKAWNAAIDAAAADTLAYARRHHDIRQAALEVMAENLGRLKSPQKCSCCGQPLPGTE